MVQFELDLETWLIYPIFALGAATGLGIVQPTLIPWFDLSETVFQTGNIEWSIARALSLVALLAVVINRDDGFGFDEWSTFELWAVYVTLGLVIAPPFFPELQETLVEPIWAFIAFTAQSIGFVLITYIN